MQLTQTKSVSLGDWFVLWASSQGDFRGVAFSDMLVALQDQLSLGRPEADSQYAGPAGSGFTVNTNPGANDIHLMLTPVADYAAGTIVLPIASGCRDKQLIIVNSTHAVTALTITPNGAGAVVGAPTALTAGAFFTLCYDLPTSTWYRIA